MTAIKLDGKLTRDEIVADLTTRVAALRDKGITPGLGTVLVGDDPGSHSYVKMKHRDCEEVGIASIRRDLPADTTQAELEAVIDELNADPACTGYIVQLPLPAHLVAGSDLPTVVATIAYRRLMGTALSEDADRNTAWAEKYLRDLADGRVTFGATDTATPQPPGRMASSAPWASCCSRWC